MEISTLKGWHNRIVSLTANNPLAVFISMGKIEPSLRAVLGNIYSERTNIMLFAPKEKGQGLVEYAIILALVAIVVIAVMRLLGPKIGNTFSTISNSLPN
jgi:pilus assembly protein Flp/PilA